MKGRYVIQFHQGSEGGDHFDFMLHVGAVLLTFQLPGLPSELAAQEHFDGRRLPDHRERYLSYEGPVSGDRGRVRIVDRGTYDAPVAEDDRWVIDLSGLATRGRFELRRLPEGLWRLSRVAGPN